MGNIDWADELSAAVTVCDLKGILVYMNKLAIEQFQKYGGERLIGNSLIECHPEPSRSKLLKMLAEPTENIYTTEKNGLRKIIAQKPWMQDGVFSGIIEISFELPNDMLHHKHST